MQKVMWYIADLFFKSTSNVRNEGDCLWEEAVYLLMANDSEQARRDAESIGRAQECEYETATGEWLKWRLERVAAVASLDAEGLSQGAELFSRLLSEEEVRSLLTPFDE